jgi:hypothetical protein
MTPVTLRTNSGNQSSGRVTTPRPAGRVSTGLPHHRSLPSCNEGG